MFLNLAFMFHFEQSPVVYPEPPPALVAYHLVAPASTQDNTTLKRRCAALIEQKCYR